jgi:hypothetical protein
MITKQSLNNLKAKAGSKYEGYNLETIKLALKKNYILPDLKETKNNNLNGNNNQNKVNDPRLNLLKDMTVQEIQKLIELRNNNNNAEKQKLDAEIKALQDQLNNNQQVIDNTTMNTQNTNVNTNDNNYNPNNVIQSNNNSNGLNVNKEKVYQQLADKLKAEVEAKQNAIKLMEKKLNEQNKLMAGKVIINKLTESLKKKGCISPSVLTRDPEIINKFKCDPNTEEIQIYNPDGSDSQLDIDQFVDLIKDHNDYRPLFNTYAPLGNTPNAANGKLGDVKNLSAMDKIKLGIETRNSEKR